MDDIKNLKVNLDSHILKSKRVVIVPHLGIDFDAIASGLGLELIASKLKKPSVILVDDPVLKMDQGVKKIIDDNRHFIIDYKEYLQTKDEEDYFILTDVNKRNLIALKEELLKEKVLVIDHHNVGTDTLEAEYKYINQKMSSASEIITKLLCLYRIKITPQMATYLLTGIYLDTNRLTKNASSSTFNTVSKLLEKGAEIHRVNELFTEDFYSDRKVQELISLTNMLNINFALASAKEDVEYTKEELAKAADYLLKYRVDASFAIGNIGENTVSVSARSKGTINVGEIMQQLDGGGNVHSAAARLQATTVHDVTEKLMRVLVPKYYNENVL